LRRRGGGEGQAEPSADPRFFAAQLLAGLYAMPQETGEYYAQYDAAVYEQPSSLAAVSGKWTIRNLSGAATGTLMVSANGSFSGLDILGCGYSGAISHLVTCSLLTCLLAYSLRTGSIVIVSSGRGRFCRRLLPQRMTSWSLVSFVLFVRMAVGTAAEPSQPSFTIDFDRLPFVAFETKNVPVIQILNQISDALHIEVGYATPVDHRRRSAGRSRETSTTFRGACCYQTRAT
jgi:hypothetical protein